MTLIIGEIGSNFESKQDIFDSILSLKEVGADCAKLQLYSHKELYGYDGPKLPGELPREWIPEFAEYADKVGIELMVTAFSPEGYRFIDPYVKRHKIASAETSDGDIVTAVADLGKPILMSTGGSSLEEIQVAISLMEGGNPGVDITLMYCVSAYPAKNIDLDAINYLSAFCDDKIPVGYSCHSSEWITPYYAVVDYDAKVIEKHFKIREMATPDNPHSILPGEFTKMVDGIRANQLATMFPDVDQESDFIKYSKRRFIPELGGYYRTKKP